MKYILFFLITCCATGGFAQKYNVALINDSLRKNADAVKRMEELRVIVKSPSKAVIKRKYAVTILTEAGADEAQYINSYDKMQSLESISGHLYDATGKEFKSVKKKDISDFSANDDISLMTDNRYKRHNFYYPVYPYTVEYEDEQEYNGIFFLPSWHPLENNTRYSVEQSSFVVETPADFNLRYKQIAYGGKPVEESVSGKKIYSWQAVNLVAVEDEPYHPSWNEIQPSVYIAPSQFQIDEYKGEMSTWLQLGNFINTLNSNRQNLPEKVKQEIHAITKNTTDVKEKINLMYDYLQKNTRYISVQMGIGGWQPFAAEYVANNKYGDCKALSNYMISLLKEIDVPAKYVLIKAGDNEKGLWEDFPSPYFNHAIICVPQKNDTTWLECTNQTVSAGYMGDFTGNRKALLIDTDGGHVVSTPAYPAAANLQLRKIDAVISADGHLTAEVDTHFTGLQQDDMHNLMHGATAEQKQKYLNTALTLPTYSVEKFKYTETKGKVPAIDEYLSVLSPNYASTSDKRIFIMPNFFNRSSGKLSAGTKRMYDIEFAAAYIDVDTIRIKIPQNYTVESLPKTVSIKSPYGSYSISFSIQDNVIDMLRRNERNAGVFPKSDYETIAKFLNDIYRADRGKIVLIKKEG